MAKKISKTTRQGNIVTTTTNKTSRKGKKVRETKIVSNLDTRKTIATGSVTKYKIKKGKVKVKRRTLTPRQALR